MSREAPQEMLIDYSEIPPLPEPAKREKKPRRVDKIAEKAMGKKEEKILSPTAEGVKQIIEKGKEQHTAQETFKDLRKLFDFFEAASIMDKNFLPKDLTDEKTPEFVVANFKEISAKYNLTNVEQLFNFIKNGLKKFFNNHPEPTTEELEELKNWQKLDSLRDKWQMKLASADIKLAKELRLQKEAQEVTKKEEAAAQHTSDLANRDFVTKLKRKNLADLSDERQKELLASAQRLATKEGEEGLSGAAMYQKLDKLGITSKKARVSEVQARFRNRAAASEFTGGAAAETRTSLINPLEKSISSVTTAPLQEEKSAKQEGAWRNFWKSLTGNYEEREISATPKPSLWAKLREAFSGAQPNKEKTSDKLLAQVIEKQKAKYAPRLKEMQKTGLDFTRANSFAGVNVEEYKLINDIMKGRKGQISNEERKTFKAVLDKVMKYTSKNPENKTQDILAGIYIDLAEQIGEVGEAGMVATAKLVKSRAKRLSGYRKDNETGGSVGGIFSGTPGA